tara:strand:+ start:1079 stop:1243 length:165 start_codon:yes stop_codon:yes gene_type:complete
MRQATSSDGTLTAESLSRELLKESYDKPTAEQVIGSAELDGVLIRNSPTSWAWL